MDIVTRDMIKQILLAWQAGRLQAPDVHDWASARYPTGAAEDELVNDILARLDMLDVNLMTPDDLPPYLEVLDLPLNNTARAIALLDRHDASIDVPKRKQIVNDDPFYSRFCR